ncbi:hypothetical protein H6G81_19370 [Scytonema hofmannii FACHB-248]|uniref:Uncharacterized protein n=1 Tax=Scytonema hofmannii FACHB-248 TaxID=1842502 RepID=A0ABR8GT27_9CYAN|nr:hypothetical protein [Scytonema hofmannii]MBD2606632.1 hypothetical protein [Scytonema hofmannii FACHB-248]
MTSRMEAILILTAGWRSKIKRSRVSTRVCCPKSDRLFHVHKECIL